MESFYLKAITTKYLHIYSILFSESTYHPLIYTHANVQKIYIITYMRILKNGFAIRQYSTIKVFGLCAITVRTECRMSYA